MEEDGGVGFCKILLIEDFDKICRCCLSQNPLDSIFEIMYEGTNLDKIFNSLFSTQLDHEDDLPKKICETCISQLISCHIFKKRYEASEAVLRNIFAIKIEDVDLKTISQHPEGNIEKPQETQLDEKMESDTSNNAKENLEPNLNIVKVPDFKENGTCVKAEENFEPKKLTVSDSKESDICDKAEQSLELKVNIPKELTVSDSKESDKQVENFELTVKKPKQPSKKFTCSCGEIFTSKLEFRQHRESTNHQKPRTHPCETCGKLFAKEALYFHSRIHNSEKWHACHHCPKRFASSANFQRHMKQHTGERPYLCEFCGKAFIQHGSLEVHRRVHTGEKPHLCNYCGKGFRNSSTCNTHIRIHKGQKSPKTPGKMFVCVECGKSCFSQAGYKFHLYNKHGIVEEEAGENKYQCEICKKFYASKNSLAVHILTHKDEKRFLCNECGKSFFKKGGLTSHALTHSSEKSLACEFCGKKFARRQSLRTHRYAHTGERPFACSLCPQKFRQSTHLNSHLMVHTGEKPHLCQVCNKSFRQKHNFDVHVRTHTGEKPFECENCAQTFHDSGSLKKHKHRKHQI